MKRYSSLRKVISVLTAIVITAPVCVINATALSQDTVSENQNCIAYNQDFYNANTELCNTIKEGMQNMQTEIDIEKYQLTINDVKTAMRTVTEMNPELFYVSKTTFSCAVGTCVARLVPKYTYSVDRISVMREELNNRTNEILENITPDMSDFQKAAIIHDEIVLGCEYSNSPDSQFTRTSVYDCLVNGYANCQGYSSALSYMLEQVGIKSEIVESSQMNHIWNLVAIDGKYYHVDATFDDPTPDRFGYVSHKYFLLSDGAIKTSPNISAHYGFRTINAADSTVYDNSYYQTINTKLCYVDDFFYAADNNYGSDYAKKLVALDPESDFVEPVAEISDKWYTGDGLSYWQDSFISVDEFNGSVYFNLNNAVCKYNVADGTVNRITNITDTSGNTYIYGMRLNKTGKLLIDVKKSPTDFSNAVVTETLPETNYEQLDIGLGKGNSAVTPHILSGDINEDSILSVLDVTLLQMICSGSLEPTKTQELAADFNDDGKIDVNDATALQMALTNPN